MVDAAAAGRDTHGSYLNDGVVAEPSPLVGSDQGTKLARKIFAEVMDLLEQYEPGCRNNLQRAQITRRRTLGNESISCFRAVFS